jgi:hypothetical protein
MLDPNYMPIAQQVIDSAPPGIYKLKELYGESGWACIKKPRGFGRRFKRSVSDRHLKRLVLLEKRWKGDSIRYKVGPPPAVREESSSLLPERALDDH